MQRRRCSRKQPENEKKRKNKMIKAGIIGATGYAGAELVRILTGHKEVEIKWYGSKSYIDEKYERVYRNLFKIVDAACMDDNMEELAKQVELPISPRSLLKKRSMDFVR